MAATRRRVLNIFVGRHCFTSTWHSAGGQLQNPCSILENRRLLRSVMPDAGVSQNVMVPCP